jgi:8-oxo-dGTP pyrophosphatase MutT (NUDIX family)
VSSETTHNTNNKKSAMETPPMFDEAALSYDHYNGVTLDLGIYLQQQQQEQQEQNDPPLPLDRNSVVERFTSQLQAALTTWQGEGRRGIWIHVPTSASHFVPTCTDVGFRYHNVLRSGGNDEDNKSGTSVLVLSRWLPPDEPSRLPFGPTHQVGVGTVVLNPRDPTEMLVVQERTGPAATYRLWKMPTGLLDPDEDIPDGARRELLEETGLSATLDGVVCFRQAHRPGSTSDLFFVCSMRLDDDDDGTVQWSPQDGEIADIRWMAVEEYCLQDRWRGSPLYETLNGCILHLSNQRQQQQQQELQQQPQQEVSSSLSEAGSNDAGLGRPTIIEHHQLEVGFGRDGTTNALFMLPPTTVVVAASSSSSSTDQSKLGS